MVEKKLLPNLLVIGAAKAGTTALHVYLGEHPQIFMPKIKEPQFFLVWENAEQMRINEEENHAAFNKYNTIDKYTEIFVDGKDCLIRGESSPQYLSYPHCAVKIKKLIPEVKIIAVLRNPVDRAFSHYLMMKYRGLEKRMFEEAIDEEKQTGRLHYPYDMRYLQWGKYVEQLKPYMNLFSSDQLKICLYDDFKTDPQSFIKNIFNFLDVDESFTPKFQNRHNVSLIKRYEEMPKIDRVLNYARRKFRDLEIPFLERSIQRHRFYRPALKPGLSKKLEDYYSVEISDLEKLIGKDLSGWKKQNNKY